MKKMMMTLVALLTFTAAMAQNEKKECQPFTAEQRTEMMAKKLNLTTGRHGHHGRPGHGPKHHCDKKANCDKESDCCKK